MTVPTASRAARAWAAVDSAALTIMSSSLSMLSPAAGIVSLLLSSRRIGAYIYGKRCNNRASGASGQPREPASESAAPAPDWVSLRYFCWLTGYSGTITFARGAWLIAPTSVPTMANQRQKDTGGLDGIAAAVRGQSGAEGPRALPPVHLWDPPFCGDLDIRIAADGTWFYLGSPIGRQPLVRLFASVIKREGDKYFL